jgi:dipeptidyl-peptidase-2
MRSLVLLGGLVAAVQAAIPEYREMYSTQRVDHFDGSNNATFQLRYLLPKGEPPLAPPPHASDATRPIFLYCGNEGGIDAFWGSTGLPFDAAPVRNALVVFAEHRYYGRSLPYGAASTAPAHIGKLTVEQALADYAELVAELREQLGHTAQRPVPVIAFGGSYGGWLAAWLRMKYPTACDGALAASANLPLAAGNVDEGAFFDGVTHDFAQADDGCPDLVRAALADFERREAAADWASLRGSLRLCDDSGGGGSQLQNASDARTLYLWLMNGFTTIAQVNYPYPAALPVAWPARHACATLRAAEAAAGGQPYDRLAAVAQVMGVPYNASFPRESGVGLGRSDGGARGNPLSAQRRWRREEGEGEGGEERRLATQTCFAPKEQFFECADQTGCFAPHDPWGYQTCTECLYATSTNNVTDMFPPRAWREANISAYCAAEWPGAQQLPGWIDVQYGGRDEDWKTYTNIVFSNGKLDPWHKGGILRNISETVVAVIVDDGAHHYDLREAHPNDTQSVVDARRHELAHIDAWIEQARANVRG